MHAHQRRTISRPPALTLLLMASASSVRLMRDRSFSALLDILLVPSWGRGGEGRRGEWGADRGIGLFDAALLNAATAFWLAAALPGKAMRGLESQTEGVPLRPLLPLPPLCTCKDMTLAPAGGMKTSGTLNTRPPRPPRFFQALPPYRPFTRSAISRVSSKCCF